MQNTPRVCLTEDDLEAINALYPDCTHSISDPVCFKMKHNIGYVRVAVYILLPALIALFFSLLLAACTQKQAGSRLRKVGGVKPLPALAARLPARTAAPPLLPAPPLVCPWQARELLKQKSQALRQVGDLAASQQQANEEAQAQLRAQQATERWRIETMVQRRLKALGRSSGGGLLAGRGSMLPPEYQADSIEMPPPTPRTVGWFFGGRSRSSLRTTSFCEGARTTDQTSHESPVSSPRIVVQGSTISADGSEAPSETPSECAQSHIGPVAGPGGASLAPASPTSNMSLSSKGFFGRRRMMQSGRVPSHASQPSGQPSSDRVTADGGASQGWGARTGLAASGEQRRRATTSPPSALRPPPNYHPILPSL